MSTDINHRLQRAIELAQAGKLDDARPLLKQVVLERPDLPLAWMWLAAVSSNEQERISALQRVLALEPNNQRAKSALQSLGVVEGNVDEVNKEQLFSNDSISEDESNKLAAFDGDYAPPPPAISPRFLLTAQEWVIVGAMLLIAVFALGSVVFYENVINAPTATPTATNTLTPSATFTPRPTNTPRPTRTPVPQFTLPPAATATNTRELPTLTPRPTFTPIPTSTPNAFELSQLETQRRVWGG